MKLEHLTNGIRVRFYQRKYRMVTLEVGLFFAFLVLNGIIINSFPVVSETVLGNEPWYPYYMLLAGLDLLLLVGMFFVLGAWLGIWYSEKEVEYNDEP